MCNKEKVTEQELKVLIDRYLKGQCTEEEKALVDSLFDSYRKKNQREPFWPANPDNLRAKMLKNIKAEIRKKKKTVFPTMLLRIAASIALIIGIGLAFYFNQPTAEVQYLTKSTTRGQKATITLSDGSTVRLNAESSIGYPAQFTEASREIRLEGEAFFEVKRDESRPFVVSSHQMQTTVLGTSFNIDAYDPATVSVALVSGKVKVNTTSDNQTYGQVEMYLKPGERAVYTAASGDITKRSFNVKQHTAWKDGIIYLSDATYTQVFDQLARWYGVEFEFVNQPKEEWDYSGEFKDMSLELVLESIGYASGFDFQIQDKVIMIEFEN